jgi:predicted acetyltransferase
MSVVCRWRFAIHDVGVTTDIRVLDTEGDLVAAANVFRAAMIGFPRLADLAPGQITRFLEPGRTIGAFVDDQLIGTADAVTSTLTLPGGTTVDHAAVTHIGVLPSFTRRGVATDLVRHQLHDFGARGEAVATLRASEATIYERYGYGAASSSQTVEVQAARATLRPGVAAGGPVRLLDPTDVWDVLPRIYAEHRPSRPGTIDRPDMWWYGARLRTESGSGPWYVAVHGTPGSQTGFVRYRPIDTDKWFVSDQRTIVVEDFFAPDIDSYLGLLRFLLGLDLIDRVVFWMLPVDDPLPWLLLDRRAARVTATHDETWLRIVDVEKTLTARQYAGDGTVTIAVDDPLLPDNSITLAIMGEGAERTDRPPQLHVGIAGLAAVLLGGTTWHSLAVAGVARAESPAHLVAADRLFAVQHAPYAGFFF